jgi:hypothetical protein
MDTQSFVLTDLEKLHLAFRAYRSHDGLGYWFRGHADSTWDLLPKAGRGEYRLPENNDLGRFYDWCQQAVAYSTLPKSELERLALAQHHGLATRLLDWSKNPLVACYFACHEKPTIDGVIYILETPQTLLTDEFTLEHMKREKGLFGYIPKAITPRVLNQKGLFTVHCDATYPIEIKPCRIAPDRPNLVRITIPSAMKNDVIQLLNDYGIDRSVLFPDLDGLSSHINSQTISMPR